MVGIPFKLLDKKSEKKFMFSRRKELTLQLQEATDAKEIFELAIILLFQQTRGIVICGDEITRVVLIELLRGKKIPSKVKQNFEQTSLLFQNGKAVPDELIAFVKNCGLSKDISAYVEPESCE